MLRGLNPSAYTSLENVIANVGIASYVAEERGVQDERGNMIRKCPCLAVCNPFSNFFEFVVHLKDIRNTNAGEDVRQAPYSNVEQVSIYSASRVVFILTFIESHTTLMLAKSSAYIHCLQRLRVVEVNLHHSAKFITTLQAYARSSSTSSHPRHLSSTDLTRSYRSLVPSSFHQMKSTRSLPCKWHVVR